MAKNIVFVLFIMVTLISTGCKRNAPSSPSVIPAATFTCTRTLIDTPSITETYTATSSITQTYTITVTFSITMTSTITKTRTISPTRTVTPLPTFTCTVTPTKTPDLHTYNLLPESVVLKSIREDSAGGFVLCGDSYLARLHPSGVMDWEILHAVYEAFSMIIDTDGNYVTAGYGDFGSKGYGSAVTKLESAATHGVIWKYAFGTNYLAHDTAYDIKKSNDGGFVITGTTNTWDDGRLYIRKLNSDGTNTGTWYHSWQIGDGNYSARGNSIIQATDGGYVAAGSSAAGGMVVKVDSEGNCVWAKTIPPLWEFNTVAETSDGYVLSNYKNVVKINKSSGEKVWLYTLNTDHDISNISITSNGEIGVFGYGGSPRYFFLSKLDEYGNMIWDKTYCGSLPYQVWDRGIMTCTNDNGFIMSGRVKYNSEVYTCIIKTDNNGELIW